MGSNPTPSIMEKHGWYYLHENSTLIFKPGNAYYEDDFAGNPNVVAYWKVEVPIQRATAWRIILEALYYGMNINQAKKYAEDHDMDIYDLYTLMGRVEPDKYLLEGLWIFVKEVLEISEKDFLAWIAENSGKETLTFAPQPESKNG